jgi:hypothetical protein
MMTKAFDELLQRLLVVVNKRSNNLTMVRFMLRSNNNATDAG